MLTHSFNVPNSLYAELYRHICIEDDAILGIKVRIISTEPLVYEVERLIKPPMSGGLRLLFSIPQEIAFVSRVKVDPSGTSSTSIITTPSALSHLAKVEEKLYLNETQTGCKGTLKFEGSSSAPEWAFNMFLKEYSEKRRHNLTYKGQARRMTKEKFMEKLTKLSRG